MLSYVGLNRQAELTVELLFSAFIFLVNISKYDLKVRHDVDVS